MLGKSTVIPKTDGVRTGPDLAQASVRSAMPAPPTSTDAAKFGKQKGIEELNEGQAKTSAKRPAKT